MALLRRPAIPITLALAFCATLSLHGAEFKRQIQVMGNTRIMVNAFKDTVGTLRVTTMDNKVPAGKTAEECTLGLGGRIPVEIKGLAKGSYLMILDSDKADSVTMRLSFAMDVPSAPGYYAYYDLEFKGSGTELKAQPFLDSFMVDGKRRISSTPPPLVIAADSTDTRDLKVPFLDFSAPAPR